MLASLQIEHASLSDVGRRGTNNEDAHLAQPMRGVFAVADGMGGHAAGEVASQLALSTLDRLVATAPDSTYAADSSLATALAKQRRLEESTTTAEKDLT